MTGFFTTAFGAFLLTIALFGEVEALLAGAGPVFGAIVSFLSNCLARSLPAAVVPAPC
jgi:hypothetical protein